MGENILTTGQQKILLSAKRDPKITDSYYLTGGTALSHYYFQHRISEDFDFFSATDLDKSILERWTQITAKNTTAQDLEFQTLQGQFIYFFHYPTEVIKVDFAYFPFEHIGKFTNDENLKVSSVLDIGVNKLQALTTRSRGRDFVDLYEIIHNGNLPITELIKNYRLKYDVFIQPEEWGKNFAKVLDATDQPRFLGNRKWNEIESFFLEEAKKTTNITS